MKKLLYLICAITITSFASPTFANPMCSQQWGENGIGINDVITHTDQVERKGSQKAGQGINTRKARRSSHNNARRRR